MSEEGKTRISAYGLLQRDNKMLLCRLSQKVGMNPGKWTLPGGGIDFGEDPEDAVVREFIEETGLTVKVDKLLSIDSLHDRMPGWPSMHSIRIIYHVVYISGELQFESEGSTDLCAWHTHEEIKALPLVALATHGVALLFSNTYSRT